MTSIRKLLFFVLAMAVAAFALPAVAHDNDDSFSVVIAPGTVAGTFTAKITSLERSDDEKIRSFKISVPLGGSISSATLSGTGSFSNATRVPAAIPPATADVTFKNVTIRYNQYIIVTMTAALPGATSCGSTNLNWKAYAWEGSNATGDQFDLDASNSNLTTSVSNTCTLEFLTQPKDALTNAIITTSPYNNPIGTAVQVRLVVNGSTAPSSFDRSVSLSSSCSPPDTLTLAGAGASSSSGVASFSSLKSSTKGAGCTLTASATGFGTAPSASFKVVDATLKFTAVPTSIAPGAASQPVAVSLVDGSNATIPAASPAVNLSVQSGTCTLGQTGLPTTTGVATFSGLVFGGTAGTCALKADGTFDGVPFSATSASFPVFVASNLGCNAAPPPGPPAPGPGYFANLPTGVSTVTDVGYAAGYRTANDKFNPCNVLNYTFTNNIKGSGPTLDNAGNILPVNAVSMVWDSSYEPNAVFTYTLTFLPESVGADGLPSKHTKFCKLSATPPTDCTLAANQQNLQACIGTALSASSIPGADPACIAEESWTVVDPALCGNSPVTGPACVRVINRLIDARDPPINRG